MATREEIADILAGFTLFGDLQTPQLLGVASIFDEVVFPSGRADPPPGADRIGLLRDPRRHRGRPDRRQQRATLGRGDFFGEVSILLGEPPTADVVATTALRCIADRRQRRRGLPRQEPPGHVPDAPGPGASTPQRQPLAELTVAADMRPFPPGEYPVDRHRQRPRRAPGVVRRSEHYGVQHAVLSADPSPGGMFRRWPFFQRLLSWTKPYAPEELVSREYQRYDWNSLIAFEPELRSLQAEFMDGSSYFPSRPEMEASLDQLRRQGRDRRPLRLPLGAHPARGRTRRPDVHARDHRRRVPHADPRAGGRHRGAVDAQAAGHRARAPLRGDARGVDVRRQAAVHHRQAELGLRARLGPRGRGRRRSRSRRRRPPRPRSRRSRWSASGRATCSRSRTTSSASASRSSTPRSTRSSTSATGTGSSSSGPTTGSR